MILRQYITHAQVLFTLCITNSKELQESDSRAQLEAETVKTWKVNPNITADFYQLANIKHLLEACTELRELKKARIYSIQSANHFAKDPVKIQADCTSGFAEVQSNKAVTLFISDSPTPTPGTFREYFLFFVFYFIIFTI